MPKKSFFLVAAILWTTLVIYLSLAAITVNQVSWNLFKNQDKIVHFTFYFVFTFFWFESINPTKKIKIKLLIVITLAILLGLAMELCQDVYTNYRNPDVWDVFANSLGAIVAGILLFRFRLKKT